MRLYSLVVMFVLALSALASAAPVPDWDHEGFDASNSFYNPGESAINATTINGLTRRWSVSLRRHDGACGGPSAPLVAAGLVIATDEKGIAANRAPTGRLVWTWDWDDPDDSSTPSMAVVGSTLILGNARCYGA
ncbi:hypothetical protein [Actinoplanes solisilvae]|uniref:hypothetical protein n=1 Tax=Actinoplanes solisilvae TaxID=2486853 RepID=UPI000FDB8AC6|nr:hypothetical protein [Actinoplanes solisilvae]